MAAETFPETRAAPRRAESIDAITGVAVEDSAPGLETYSFSGAFDAAFDLYKRHFGVLALIVAYVFIPTQVILYAAGNVWFKPLAAHYNVNSPDGGLMFQLFWIGSLLGSPGNGVPGYLSLMTSFMVSGPVSIAVGNILIGRPTRVSGAYRRATPVLRRLFLVWMLLGLVMVVTVFMTAGVLAFAIGLIAAFGAMAVSTPEISTALAIGMVIVTYFVCSLVCAFFFAFSPPLIALENLTVLGSVERNFRLMRGRNFWRIVLSIALLPIVTFGLQVLTLISASAMVATLHWPPWTEFVINTGLSSLIAFFFQPYWMIFLTLLYFDARVRQEGLDLRYMADNLPELDPLLAPPPPAHGAAAEAAGMPPPFPTAAPPVTYVGQAPN
ncbi:MAG TPA: hypothetical protein VKT77_15490 [Chthonomonadaceae bacterium]|nr:hypothetical protein [Chthonomonadaceae bacterium]